MTGFSVGKIKILPSYLTRVDETRRRLDLLLGSSLGDRLLEHVAPLLEQRPVERWAKRVEVEQRREELQRATADVGILVGKAREAGHVKASTNLGILYWEGLSDGAAGMYEEARRRFARELWEEADELGITEAGRCLRNAESGEWELLGPPDSPA